MRPVRLRIEAFGPFKGVEEIDFEALSQHEIFTVSGKTGTGKTAIFDAMFFALFAKLPGRRSSYDSLKSHHADEEVICNVQFDFYAKGKLWRVERSPRYQKKGNKNPTSAKSTLSEITVNGIEPRVTKHSDVKGECETIIGLKAEQFERVVLIPQGEFKQILDDKLETRQELLRSLFGTEIYDQISEEVDKERKQLGVKAEAAKRQIRDEVNRHAKDLAKLEQEFDTSGNLFVPDIISEVTGNKYHKADASSEKNKSDRTKAPKISDLTFEDFTRASSELVLWLKQCETHSTKLTDTLTKSEKHSSELNKKLELAELEYKERQRYEDLTQKLIQYNKDEPELKARRDNARRADGLRPLRRAVSESSRVQKLHSQNQAALQHHINCLKEQIAAVNVNLEDAAALPTGFNSDGTETEISAEIHKRLESDLNRFAQISRSEKEISETTTAIENGKQSATEKAKNCERVLEEHLVEIASIKSELENLGEPQDLTTLQNLCDVSAANVATSLELISAGEALSTNQSNQKSTKTSLEQFEVSIEEAAQAQALLPEQEKALGEAERRHESLQEAIEINNEIEVTRHKLDVEASKVDVFDTESEQALDRYLSSTVIELATRLEEGQPCGVCGSIEHPNPAQPGSVDESITREAVTQAQEKANQQRKTYTTIESKLESLKNKLAEKDSVQHLGEALELSHNSLQRHLQNYNDTKTRAAALQDLQRKAKQLNENLQILQQEQNRIEKNFVRYTTSLNVDISPQIELGELKKLIEESDFVSLANLAKSNLDKATATNETILHSRQRLEAADVKEKQLRQTKADAETEEARADQRLIEHRAELKKVREQKQSLGVKLFITTPTDIGSIENKLEQLHLVERYISDHKQNVTRVETSSKNLDDVKNRVAELLETSPISDIAELDNIADISIEQSEHDKETFAKHETRKRDTLEALQTIKFSSAEPPEIASLEAAVHQIQQSLREAQEQQKAAEKQHNLFFDNYQRIENDLETTRSALESHIAQNALLPELETLHTLISQGNESDPIGLENWVLAKHLRIVTQLANQRLHRSSGGRFELVVQDAIDTGSQTKLHKGLEIRVLDHSSENPIPRDAAGLSGGELFQASLALALGTADAVMQKTAATQIEAMFIDEGFGTLDEESLEMAIDVLSELSCDTTTVAVITHVKALLDVLPRGIEVKRLTGAQGSTTKVFAAANTGGDNDQLVP